MHTDRRNKQKGDLLCLPKEAKSHEMKDKIGDLAGPHRNGGAMTPPDYAELWRLLDRTPPSRLRWSITTEGIDYGDIRTVFRVAHRYEAEEAARLAVAAVNALPWLLAEAEAGRRLRKAASRFNETVTMRMPIEGDGECMDAHRKLDAALADYDREVGT